MIIGIIETVIALVLIFGALVLFHELGHFIAARLVGVRVEEFAFGFGPKLLRLFKRGDTEYTIHPVPVGGFVKLAGTEPGEEDVPDGLFAQSRPKRALIFVFGPLASLVLAVLIFVCLGVFWGFPHESKTANRVLLVYPQTVASRIGLRAGDRIVEIDGRRFTSGNEMTQTIYAHPGKTIGLLIERNGRSIRRKATPAWTIEYAGFNWSFMDPQTGKVERVLDPGIARKTGIREDDIIVSVNGNKVTSGKTMLSLIQRAGETAVSIVVRRGDETVRATVRPSISSVRFAGTEWFFPSGLAFRHEALSDSGAAVPKSGFQDHDRIIGINGSSIKTGSGMLRAIEEGKGRQLVFLIEREQKKVRVTVRPTERDYTQLDARVYNAIGLLGFIPQQVLVKEGFPDSVVKGFAATWQLLTGIISSLAPSRISESVGGPLMIVKQTASMVAVGPYYVAWLAGILSMSLVIVNLLPIPVLDGGHLLILLIESIRKRQLSPQQMQFATLIGLAIIGLIVVTVVYSDIAKWSQGLVPQ